MANDDRTKECMQLRSKLEKLGKAGARFSTLVGVDIDDANQCALAGKQPRSFPSDTGCSSGDECPFS